MKLWCERAWLGGSRVANGVVLEIDGDRIATVTEGVGRPPRDAERCAGVAVPGLANAHSHAFHRALRGRTQAERGSFWTWRAHMYRLAATLTPDAYLALATAVYAEMALAGITTVGEFHYLHHGPGGVPYADPNAMGDALAEAAGAAGVRLTLLDTCYLHGGIGREPDEIQRRFSDRTTAAWAERASARRAGCDVRLGAAIHSVRAVAPEEMTVVAEWAAARGACLHAHVSEQPAENEACLSAYGVTPVGLLADRGILGSSFTAVHATHLTADDVARLGGGGSQVCFCPTTERDLADGVGPAEALTAAGAKLCLGSDSHAVIDLLEEARAVELDERLATGGRGHHAALDLLGAATRGGVEALGWPEAGRLEAGALADVVVIATDSVRLAGADADNLLDAVVFAATASDVRDVMIGGCWVVRDAHHETLDVPAALAASITSVSP
jgi:formiminoglutamate deiminase